jgi:hypothetical protein
MGSESPKFFEEFEFLKFLNLPIHYIYLRIKTNARCKRNNSLYSPSKKATESSLGFLSRETVSTEV